VSHELGIAIYQSKGLLRAYPRLAWNFKFIKGSVHNLQKTGRHTLVQWYGFVQTILKS